MSSANANLGRRDFLRQTGQLSLLAAAAGAWSRAAAGPAPAVKQPAHIDPAWKTMGLAVRTRDLTDESFTYLAQIGVEHVRTVTTDYPGFTRTGVLDVGAVRDAKRRIEQHGMHLSSIDLDQSTLSNLLLGLPGADADLDRYCGILEVMGQAGVRSLNYSLLTSRAIRSRYNKPLPGHHFEPNGRGGAVLQNYDDALARQTKEEPAGRVSADEMWARITRFVQRCVPVAEKAGVVMGLHPDDPPVKEFWGVTQVLNSLEGLERFLRLAPSPNNCFVFCQGTIQEAHIDVPAYIRHFGPQGKIALAELRGVRGAIPSYREEFMDGGDLSMLTVIRTLKEVGYTGPVEVAHVPGLINDRNEAVVQAWSVGYLQGVIAMAYEEKG